MQVESTLESVGRFWDEEILPTITRYIEIPNQSPLFDPNWEKNGYMHQAVELVRQFIERNALTRSRLQIFDEPGRTPLILLEVEGDAPGNILLYGHLDKQPAMVGWEEGLGPWTPVLRDGKLYGRGSADDGYAVFACVAAVRELQRQNIAFPRLTIMIECCEESGSFDLPHYVELCSERIGEPDLVICLDSGCGDYERVWTTTSLRGSIVGNLHAEVLSEGVHSGDASGIVPSAFRVLRQLLDRLEDAESGDVIPEWLSVEIPEEQYEEAKRTAAILGDVVFGKFPKVGNLRPMSDDPVELLLNGTWRPTLSITGQGGMPELVQSGNVLLPKVSLKLSIRIPPTIDATDLDTKLAELFETDPPHGAKVVFESEKGATGWRAPKLAEWLDTSISDASKAFFGRDAASMGEGGSIPFMGMLSERFPNAQFLVTGVLGPRSNAHGPNEFLHIDMVKRLTACVAKVIADCGTR